MVQGSFGKSESAGFSNSSKSSARPRGRRADLSTPTDARLILNIRWLALTGQLCALLFIFFFIQMDFPIIEALLILALAMGVNAWQTSRLAEVRASEEQGFLALVFDVAQLFALLFLTGGLLNPFAILLLGPVVVSAAILPRGRTFTLIAFTALAITLLSFFSFPLPWIVETVRRDDSYLAGLWMAMVLSVTFIGAHVWWVASRARRLGEALAEARLVLAREQKALALGARATVAAHRLGSPLNTIALVCDHLSRETATDHPFYDDMVLLRSEIERCRMILGELDCRQSAEELELDLPVPLDGLIREVIDNRIEDNRIEVAIVFSEESALPMPLANRKPELLHAFESLLTNAIDFATERVVLEVHCTMHEVNVNIQDDGPGFSTGVLASVGVPWNTSRSGRNGHRGLGIFLASTLIETLGGTVSCANGPSGGALVVMCLPRDSLIAKRHDLEE